MKTILAVLLLAAAAFGQRPETHHTETSFVTVGTLLKSCQADKRFTGNPNPNYADTVNAGLCTGYVAGVLDGLLAAGLVAPAASLTPGLTITLFMAEMDSKNPISPASSASASLFHILMRHGYLELAHAGTQ